MSLKKLKQHEFIDMYLQYTDNTESPKIMHLWSSLASASACIGRHAYLSTGIGNIYANIFTLLVGPPGTRKSQAMKYSTKLVRKYTSIRFAPDDTGSQRQGLLMALVGDSDNGIKINKNTDIDSAFNSFNITNNISIGVEEISNLNISTDDTDKYCLFAAASEFSTFMGNGDALTAAMLNKIWDGEPYDYRLKNERNTLENSLMTIVGCTTQSEIARILPAESIGQGFMSRWILCFAPKRDKLVPINKAGLKVELESDIGNTFAWLYNDLRGDIVFNQAANDLQEDIYLHRKSTIEDSRFIYYTERRHTHLLKAAILLATLRRSAIIELIDIEMGNLLLELTEAGMPDALGEFGLSPLGNAKQKLLEFLQHVNEPVKQTLLYSVMSNDMKLSDFKIALAELENKKKIVKMTLDSGTNYAYIDDLSNIWDDLITD